MLTVFALAMTAFGLMATFLPYRTLSALAKFEDEERRKYVLSNSAKYSYLRIRFSGIVALLIGLLTLWALWRKP